MNKVKLIAVAILMLVPSIAFAQDAGAEPSTITRIAGVVLSVVAPLVILMVTWLAMKGVTYLEKKLGFEITESMEAKIEQVVEKAVGFGEQYALKKTSEGTKKIKGSKKMEAALSFGVDLAEKYKLPDWAKDKLQDLIEAKLGIENMKED